MLWFQKPTKPALSFLLLASFIVHSLGLGQHESIRRQSDREEAVTRMPIIQAATTLFSLPFSLPNSVRASITQHCPCFPQRPCPNLDFRDGGNVGGGVKERIREAVVKTLDMSRSVVEDSAKSAAEAVDMTVKKTLSRKGREGVAAEL